MVVFQESKDSFVAQQSSIMASLALIGGFDKRPRLGGRVILADSGCSGLVSRINARGKILVRLLDRNEVRKVPLSSIVQPAGEVGASGICLPQQDQEINPLSIPFSLEQFMCGEDSIRVATHLFGLASLDFRMDKEKWKTVVDNPDTINIALLRQQQLRLALLKAVKVFFDNQNILRYIVCQQVT